MSKTIPSPDDLFPEQLIEAMEASHGIIGSATKYIQSTWGCKISYSALKKQLEEWQMSDWIVELRKSAVEKCINKTLSKGIDEGDNACLFKMIDKYGSCAEFLSDNNSINNSVMPKCAEILEVVNKINESNKK